MADYTELEKRAQKIFDDILAKYHEYNPGFDIGTIDPILYFSNNIKRYGICRDVKDETSVSKKRIELSRRSIATEYWTKSVLVHELTHAIGFDYHDKAFKEKLKELDAFFDVRELTTDEEVEEALFALLSIDPNMYHKIREHNAELERRRKERQKKYEEEKKKEQAWIEKIRKESIEKTKNKTREELLDELRNMTQKKQA